MEIENSYKSKQSKYQKHSKYSKQFQPQLPSYIQEHLTKEDDIKRCVIIGNLSNQSLYQIQLFH